MFTADGGYSLFRCCIQLPSRTLTFGFMDPACVDARATQFCLFYLIRDIHDIDRGNPMTTVAYNVDHWANFTPSQCMSTLHHTIVKRGQPMTMRLKCPLVDEPEEEGDEPEEYWLTWYHTIEMQRWSQMKGLGRRMWPFDFEEFGVTHGSVLILYMNKRYGLDYGDKAEYTHTIWVLDNKLIDMSTERPDDGRDWKKVYILRRDNSPTQLRKNLHQLLSRRGRKKLKRECKALAMRLRKDVSIEEILQWRFDGWQ